MGVLKMAEAETDRETAEFDLVKNPHEHPLMLYREGKFVGNGEFRCKRCDGAWRPPVFSCSASECNFHLHESCVDFPREIHTPFHPHPDHTLILSFDDTNDPCHCCSQNPFGKYYQCASPQCNFLIDLPCAIVTQLGEDSLQPTPDGLFRHFAHPHPLALQQQQHRPYQKVDCLVCQLLVTSGPAYFCSRTDSYFHPECAERPRQLHDPRYHEHPLFLFPRPLPFVKHTTPFLRKKKIDPAPCASCSNQCIKFFYSCPPCNFYLHVACLSTFKHPHDFATFRTPFPYKCQICKGPGDASPWYCTICHLFAHKRCAISYLSEQLDGPGPSRASSDISPNAQNQNEINNISHFSHEHALTLCPRGGDDRLCVCVCDGCMLLIPTQSQSYGCSECGFYLHQECARLPRQHKNSSLHRHELSMVYIPDFVFSCAVCHQYCHGFAYRCAECHYAIDIRCAAAFTVPFAHASHPHPLTRYTPAPQQHCEACGLFLWQEDAFGCDDCKVYLDARCAHLPLAIRNRFDEHPLILTFVNLPSAVGKRLYESILEDVNEHGEEDEDRDFWSSEDEDRDRYYARNSKEEEDDNDSFEEVLKESGENEYYCDICEEGRREDEAFYWCRLCCFAAHPRCVIGEYPFLKSAKCEEAHQHPLSMVKQGKKDCGACGKSCEGELAFECGRCKFNVHAFGLCYHQQLTQGRISFIMPSLRDRSIPLFLDPNEIKETKFTSLDSVAAEVASHSPTASRMFLRFLPRIEKLYFKYKQKKRANLLENTRVKLEGALKAKFQKK